jgi:hypothetical protein
VADEIRYYFDENMSGAVAAAMRRSGIDVVTAQEVGRDGLPDDEQLRYAAAEGRVLVTHDQDFLVLAATFQAAGEHFAGIAFGVGARYQHSPGALITALQTLHGVYTASNMENTVEYL